MTGDSERDSEKAQFLYDPHIFTINLFKNHRIYISKPLILLKLTLFIHYGAGSFVSSFVTVLFKERGVSLPELSAMTMIAPFCQFMGTALSGIITDKIGKSKPVFVVNVLIIISTLVGFILLPKINSTSSDMQSINLTCHRSNENEVKVSTSCGAIQETIEVEFCHDYCLMGLTDQCLTEHSDCQNFDHFKDSNTSFKIYVNNTFVKRIIDRCQYNVLSVTRGNSTYSWCSNNQTKYCTVSCTVHSGVELVHGTNGLLIVYGCLYVLFLTTYSTSYRCLDVTVMFLVKEHNSNFGHERFFAMLGNAMISPLAGYIAQTTAPPGSDRNYCSALYFYIVLCVVMVPFLYKLPMKVRPPGENVGQKSLMLLKRVYIWSFFIVLLVLGTVNNFGKNFLFWYLEGMNASSLLMGLVISISALYGLPFLLTSHWWVKKIGATQIFLLALLAHTVNLTAYSFIRDPWLALLLEVTTILTYYLLWVAVVEYSHDIAPEGLTATVIAIAGAIHYSVGKVPAGLIGMYIMDPYGGRIAFRFSAILSLSAAILYGLYLFIKKKYFDEDYQLNPTGSIPYGTFHTPIEDCSPPISDGENNPGEYIKLCYMMESDGESEDSHTVKAKDEKKKWSYLPLPNLHCLIAL